ncbi:hypothetical protein MHH33_08845 [Paenisporosarcina sp. FSL H8-0542]|uniref:hypothetical protein n=1 Tax=Paenisporosarcina sp. FSL H8-0542 TaxID=2921401 RepID=UPI00315B0BB3
MKLRFFSLTLTVLSILLICGCSTKQDEVNSKGTDSYERIRKVAWDFIEEKGWGGSAIADWKSADVKKTIADNSYELLDKTYEGKEVLRVSFIDQEDVVVGPPLILVDPETNEVIGYMPGE